jgi:hypothetical protein
LGLMSSRGQRDGRGQNERTAYPGIGTEVFAEEADAEPYEPSAGSIFRKTPAREAGTRWMPQFQSKRGGGRAEQAAHDQRYPRCGADMCKRRRLEVVMR